jgi:glucokinase
MDDPLRFVLAFDLGGTHLRAAIIDQDGTIHFSVKHLTPRTTVPGEIVSALVIAARECERGLSPGQSISGISIAVPASIDVSAGSVVKAPNLSSLNGFRLAAALTGELGPPAILENDANAAAVGEMWRGAARGYRTIVCLTLGTGVGGGIIMEEKLWHGANDSAAEIGHMGVDPFGGVPCGCGSQGCLEVYASATAIVRMTHEARPRFPDSILQNVDGLTSEEVYRAGTQGDELAREVFRRMGVYLGIGLANLINLLDPEMIVIGGGVANGWNLFENEMRQQVSERAFPLPAARVKIVRAECGDDAGLLGAARLGFDSVAA